MQQPPEPILMGELDSGDTETEELQAITRLVFFARASAAAIQSEEVVYCLDLALQHLAKDIRERTTHWPEMAHFIDTPVVHQ